MPSHSSLIHQLYSAFNHRNIDSALALMHEDVSWPKASEGGRITGKQEIRAYWTRQWNEFDPHVDPVTLSELDGDRTRVDVHQLVKNLDGDVLADTMVIHIYTITDGLVAAMHLEDESGSPSGPSAAFQPRH